MLNKTDELKDRVEAKRLELTARLVTLKADTRHEAIAAKDAVVRGLAELEVTLADGWDKVSDTVKTKLNEWLKHNDN